MRQPDVQSVDGSFEGWRVPVDRVAEWVEEHPGLVHPATRAYPFAQVWRDLWYVHVYVSGGIIDDEIAKQRWVAISLRDLSAAPDYPRLYQQAEWELLAEFTDGYEPPVNGDGLYDRSDDEAPLILYQFHGLPEERVLDVGDGQSFAVYGVELIADGARGDSENAHVLSRVVNALRVKDGLRELAIGEGDPLGGRVGSGMLIETDEGATVSV